MKGIFTQNPDLAGIEYEQNFNFKCKYCHRNLSSRQNLKEHIYIHTGEKPYVCTETGCGKSFRQGSLLSIHKKVHLEISKGLKSEKKPERKCQYPKLTRLMETSESNLSFALKDFEKHEWINRIGAHDFLFISNYLQQHN
ncbi:hypothetical protein SteCoe_22906 [Stentor coeruleus]|uniref:C2H2-type domain-containing protein n=1 Tax=Stentor coeruleus TaxID=5963 RepID=A0A1R2BL70_9CILI|nr:hypothetical protein SteCoe_22906 [Stentor coeruleus]